MKIEKNFMISGDVVEKCTSFCGIDVYFKEDADKIVHYFVKGSDVVAVQRVEADCNQNFGFISDSTFEVIK